MAMTRESWAFVFGIIGRKNIPALAISHAYIIAFQLFH